MRNDESRYKNMNFWLDAAKIDKKFRMEKERVDDSSKPKNLKPISPGIQKKLFEQGKN